MLENDLIFTQKDGVRIIKLNRPGKKNALNKNMYDTITRVLNEDAENDKISVTILTGSGDYFSSGNDMVDAMKHASPGNGNAPVKRSNYVKNMVTAFINYPKVIIAVVNGPAIGIGATILTLCDIVYASETAIFDTPFVKLGLCAEGTSSFTFSRIMGRSKASEMLLLNHRMTAQEALQFNFVSKVVPCNEICTLINNLREFGKLSPNSIKVNKSLMTRSIRKQLEDANTNEFDELAKCVDSEEFSNAIMNFMSKKSKL